MGGQLGQRGRSAGAVVAPADRLAPDFYRLWGAFTVSQIGSALGAGALPMVAILVLDASNLQVSLMAALAAVASAAIALPMGPFIEFHRKRPIMVGADALVFGALASVPVAAWLGVLTYAHVCAVVTIQTVCAIVYNAANGAYVKSLVPQQQRINANSRFETTFWIASTLGAPVGGALIAIFGLTLTVLIDAVSYLLAALGIRSIRTPEPDPPGPRPERARRAELRAGWAYIFGHPALHRLFWNAMVFGGSILMTTPLMALLMLRELGFAPWQYALSLGLPCAGGLIGSMCAPKLVGVFGERAVLLGFGVLRTCWLAPLLLAGPNLLGLVVIVATETLLLFCAGVFNPVFVTFRMNNTVDGHMARVGTAWSVSSKCAQPVFIAVGGLLAVAGGLRFAIGVAATIVVASSLLLPWGRVWSAPDCAARGSAG
ncbi:MFS transporter [Nocardia cyriacigeorgica]|uniref:MFS transporter n=1 Tax=Nocardia cyriacigeorgica TaxID=135487 RepID=UPI00189625E6|nr:MFS transporter [Nocardia cyriacigeorgica]MBF6345111.1 MFS transporter [Nocardia cyriacigeorgica]